MKLSDISKLIIETIKTCTENVVTIVTRIPTLDYFYELKFIEGFGSGFLINENLIVTNYHVVKNAASVKVITYNGEVSEANVIARDPSKDIALLTCNVKNLKPLNGEKYAKVCTKCGEQKGSANCCNKSAKRCGCGMIKGSSGCCKLKKD